MPEFEFRPDEINADPHRIPQQDDLNLLGEDPENENVNAQDILNRRRWRGQIPLVVDTIGVEIEGLFASRDSITTVLYGSLLGNRMSNLISITRDASAEIPIYKVKSKVSGGNTKYINGGTKLARKILRGNDQTVFGYELVTKPLLFEDMEFLMFNVLQLINRYGGFYSNRCATHVHVGMSNNLNTAKSALAFSTVFEELFFAIAGFGKKYRGESNNSAYSRPVVGGIYIPYRKEYIKIPNIEVALKSKNMYEFYYAFHVDIGGRLIKHHPSRYFGINMYSIVEKGTLEFRTANMIPNFSDMMAYIELCQGSAELILNSNFNLFMEMPYGNPFRYESPSYYLNKLRDLVYLINKYNRQYKISDVAYETLVKVIENTPPFKIGKRDVITHIRDFAVDPDLIYLGKLSYSSVTPEPPNQVDIHNITRKNVTII